VQAGFHFELPTESFSDLRREVKAKTMAHLVHSQGFLILGLEEGSGKDFLLFFL
jgi:hypothetical protein